MSQSFGQNFINNCEIKNELQDYSNYNVCDLRDFEQALRTKFATRCKENIVANRQKSVVYLAVALQPSTIIGKS